MKNILVGGAWPYANGSLHIGHIAALLPGDVIARYHRAIGNNVFYVSGSDCHGTPVTIRAKQEGKTPGEVSDFYHAEFVDVFKRLGFSYDLYTKTSDARHIGFVQEFHKKMYNGSLIEERTVSQAFCPTCSKILTDRLIVGKCPSCGARTRGDQCDACGEIFESDSVIEAKCAECGTAPNFGKTTQLYLLISKLAPILAEYLEEHKDWRKNAIAFTKRYIDEGLRDRAITRDLDWGIAVPKDGYSGKKIYIWAENVLGYLSASAVICRERGIPFTELFGENSRHYYVHGKDNIPFHTIILPSLLLAHGEGLRLPDDIISSEYLTLEGRKISTSENWAIWVKDIVNRYNPDAIRYFLIINGPEKRDTDFSWREFVERNNSELLGSYGNFVNRTLAFISKYQEGTVPEGVINNEVKGRIVGAYQSIGRKIEEGRLKDALDDAFELARFGNKYFDSGEPWKTRTENETACAETIFNCVYLIANLAVLLEPFLPFSSKTVRDWLSIDNTWAEKNIPAGYKIHESEILFERIDKKTVDEEVARLCGR
jgi:methionyl-tRNA synthetase